MRVCFFLIFALLLMFADRYNTTFHRFRSSISIIVTPIQYAVSLPINIVNWLITDMASQQSLITLNANLNTEITFLKAQLQKQAAIVAENQQLRELLQSSSESNDWVSEAQLLAVSPDPFVHQVVIDKGYHSNIFVGQPVLDAYGVMGQVIQVGAFTSRVLLLTDPQSAIPVQDQRNGIRAIAIGDAASGMLRLQHVTVTTDIQQNDLLITSGLGGLYPFGYPVGTVVSIEQTDGGPFANIVVEPAAHLNRSRLVLLVWTPKMKESFAGKAVTSNSPKNTPNVSVPEVT